MIKIVDEKRKLIKIKYNDMEKTFTDDDTGRLQIREVLNLELSKPDNKERNNKKIQELGIKTMIFEIGIVIGLFVAVIGLYVINTGYSWLIILLTLAVAIAMPLFYFLFLFVKVRGDRDI